MTIIKQKVSNACEWWCELNSFCPNNEYPNRNVAQLQITFTSFMQLSSLVLFHPIIRFSTMKMCVINVSNFVFRNFCNAMRPENGPKRRQDIMLPLIKIWNQMRESHIYDQSEAMQLFELWASISTWIYSDTHTHAHKCEHHTTSNRHTNTKSSTNSKRNGELIRRCTNVNRRWLFCYVVGDVCILSLERSTANNALSYNCINDKRASWLFAMQTHRSSAVAHPLCTSITEYNVELSSIVCFHSAYFHIDRLASLLCTSSTILLLLKHGQ